MRGWIELLFPPKCAACGELLPWDGEEKNALCPSCRQEWEREKRSVCAICSRELPRCECMTSEMKKAGCATFCKLVYYRQGDGISVPNRMIYHLKRERDRRASAFAAHEMAVPLRAWLEREEVEQTQTLLCYLPRSSASRLQYGTDQARELAYALGKELSLSVMPLIKRTGGGRAQKRLNFQKRLQNAKKSYRIREDTDIEGKTVLLVDDVVTSGASMAVGARLLRRKGAAKVICVAIATDDVHRNGDGASLPRDFQ